MTEVKTLGEGTFGKVILVKFSHRTVAVKYTDGIGQEYHLQNELRILQLLGRHPNIIKHGKYVGPEFENFRWKNNFAIVMKPFWMDLYTYVHSRTGQVAGELIYSYTFQMLKGLVHCHRHNILHNDLSSKNILINERGKLVLVDFGRSTGDQILRPNLWWSAPEILSHGQIWCTRKLLDKQLTFGLTDVWSVGVVISELLSQKIILCGDTKTDQLRRIVRLLGAPTSSTWPKYNKGKRWTPTIMNCCSIEMNLKEFIVSKTFDCKVNNDFISLFESMLCYPGNRITSEEALRRMTEILRTSVKFGPKNLEHL